MELHACSLSRTENLRYWCGGRSDTVIHVIHLFDDAIAVVHPILSLSYLRSRWHEMCVFLFRVSLAMLMSNLGYNQKLHNISLWRQWLRTQYKPKQPFVLELKTPPGPHVLAHLCASISKNGGMEEKRPTYRCRQGSPRKASVLCRTATVSLFSF